MTECLRSSIRLILAVSLAFSSLPAVPAGASPVPFHSLPCFQQQALAVPALADIHDAARRGTAVLVNTVKLFRKLPLSGRGMAVSLLVGLGSTLYAATAHAATLGVQTVSAGLSAVTQSAQFGLNTAVVSSDYTVKAGNAVDQIAGHFDTTRQMLLELNPFLKERMHWVGDAAQRILDIRIFPGEHILTPLTSHPLATGLMQVPDVHPLNVIAHPVMDVGVWQHVLQTVSQVSVPQMAIMALIAAGGVIFIHAYLRSSRRFSLRHILVSVMTVLQLIVPSMASPGAQARKSPPAPLVSQSAERELPSTGTQAPPQQTYTGTFPDTSGPPHYQLTMPENGFVEPLLRAKGVFQANQPIVKITRDHALYEEEENKALAEVHEFEIMDERVKQRFKDGTISIEEKQKHDMGFAVAKEKLARARDGVVTSLSLPYAGTVVQSWREKIDKGAPYLEVTDSSVRVLTLSKPQVFTPDRVALDVIRSIQNGYAVTLSIDGQPVSKPTIRIEGETFTVSVPSSRWPGGQGRPIQLSIQAPPALSSEPSYPVRHRFTYEVPAPETGIVKNVHILQPGTRLTAGAHAFFEYDTAQANSELLALQAERDFWRDATARAKALADRKMQSLESYEQLNNKLDLAEKEVSRVEKRKTVLENPVTQVASDFVVIKQFPLANGQHILKDAPLVVLGSADQFEATLFMDLASAQTLKPGDTIPLVLEGAHARFPGVVRKSQPAAGTGGSQRMEVTVDIKDTGVLRDGLRVQVEHASPKGQWPSAPAHWVVEKIRQSTDYDWVRSTLDGVFGDSTFSEKERAAIFNEVVQDPSMPALYKEWALIKLVDMGKVDVLFQFVQRYQDELSRSSNVKDRRLGSFVSRLLLAQLYEVSLYNLPSLKNERAQIDQYLASLMPASQRPVELQLLWADDSYGVISRWLESPELFPIARKVHFSRRSSLYLQSADAPLMDPDSNGYRVSMAFKTHDPRFRRDQKVIQEYVENGNVLTETLQAVAPAFTSMIRPASTPQRKGKQSTSSPLEPSNTAMYFASPETYGDDPRVPARALRSRGATLVGNELAARYETVALQSAQELIHQSNVLGLIHLFNHLPPVLQKRVLSEMAASGVLGNVTLDRETLEGNTASDRVGREIFQDFYWAALPLVTDARIQSSLNHALLKTYTAFELAQAAFGVDGTADYHAEAKRALKVRFAHDLLMERAEVLKQRAERTSWPEDPQETQAARAETAYAADAVLKSDTLDSDLLSRSGVSLHEVEAQMQHYENVFTHSQEKLWVAPRDINECTGVLILLVGALMGWMLWPKRSSKATAVSADSAAAAPMSSGNVLSLFAQTGNDAAKMVREYQENRVAFFRLIWIRALVVSVALISLSSFMELNKASHLSLLFFSLVVIDQVFNISLNRKREIFGKNLDFFPALLKFEVVNMRFSRDITREAADVFNDPMRTAMRFAAGELFWVYAWDGLLSNVAIGVGLGLIHVGLALGYFGLMAVFVALIVRISSETSEINRLGQEKERLFTQWMHDTELRVRMGFSAGSTPVTYEAVSAVMDRLIDEKMKYVTWVRMLTALIPGAGAMEGLAVSTLAIFRGMEGISFFPDWAKERSQWKRAEKSIEAFVRTLLEQPPVDSSLKGVSIDRLELRNFSLVAPGGQPLIRNAHLDLSVGVYLFYGPNDSGKSSLLQFLAGKGSRVKASGTAVYHGQRPDGEAVAVDAGKARAFAQYLRADPLADPQPVRTLMNSLENADQKDHFRALIEADLIGLDMDEKQVNGLTSGQQARVQLALVLAGTPASVILIDDALDAHIDPAAQRAWLTVLREYAHRRGKIILLAEKRDINNLDILDGRFELREGKLSAGSKQAMSGSLSSDAGVEVHDLMDVIRLSWLYMGVGLGLGLLGRAAFSDEIGLYLTIGATLTSWILHGGSIEGTLGRPIPVRALKASA